MVDEFIRGKRVALVGSGPGVMRNATGFVDSHDIVVRVNNYKLFPETGFKTDVFYSFFGSSIRKRVQDLKQDGVRLCIAKCPNAKFINSHWHEANGKQNGVDFRYIYDYRRNWWFCKTYVPTKDEFLAHFNLLGRHVPTTGFSAILDILQHEPASLYLTGFDFFQSGLHNVNEAWNKVNTDDPIGHHPQAEMDWLIANIKNYPISVDDHLAEAMRLRDVRAEGKARLYPPNLVGNKRVLA